MRKLGLFSALVLLAALPLEAQLNGVTAELQLGQNEYLPDEDLQLKVRITNRSGQEITLGTDNNWLVLSIVGENNRLCPALGNMPIQGEFSLLSGEVGTRSLNPTPYFDFRGLGRYHISARIRIPQWGEEIVCKPVAFTVTYGVSLPSFANLQFGMPTAPGATNAAPEVRSYTLLKSNHLKETDLYFRLTSSTGKVLHVFPIARMLSFSDPQAQIDRFNNLHVLCQIGARAFSYCVINPDGRWIARQTWVYTNTRPGLRVNADGEIYVADGARQLSPGDYPAPSPESARQ
jgi:hypothetical protein